MYPNSNSSWYLQMAYKINPDMKKIKGFSNIIKIVSKIPWAASGSFLPISKSVWVTLPVPPHTGQFLSALINPYP